MGGVSLTLSPPPPLSPPLSLWVGERGTLLHSPRLLFFFLREKKKGQGKGKIKKYQTPIVLTLQIWKQQSWILFSFSSLPSFFSFYYENKELSNGI